MPVCGVGQVIASDFHQEQNSLEAIIAQRSPVLCSSQIHRVPCTQHMQTMS